jgi:hypothetical protein
MTHARAGTIALGALVALVLLPPQDAARAEEPARPADVADANTELEASEHALRDYVFDVALERAERAMAAGGLDRARLARALKVRAESLAALNRPDDAKGAYSVLLAVEPTFRIDERLGPRSRAPYFDARAYWDHQPAPAGITVWWSPDEGDRVTVEVVDPLGMVDHVLVRHRPEGRGAYTESRLPAVGGSMSLGGGGPADVAVAAVTMEGNTAFEVGTERAPVSTREPGRRSSAPAPKPPAYAPVQSLPAPPPPVVRGDASVFESPWFWLVAGAVVTSAAVTGAVLATR